MTQLTETKCAKCGACAPVCPVFQITGRESHTARGKLHLRKSLAKDHASKNYAEILSLCLLCGACEAACARQIDVTSLVIEARRHLPEKTDPARFKKKLLTKIFKWPRFAAGLAKTGRHLTQPLAALLPEQSGLRFALNLLDEQPWTPPGLDNYPGLFPNPTAGRTVSYFSGCLARHLDPQISQATAYLLNQSGQALMAPKDQACCGLAFQAAGQTADAIELAKKNIIAFNNDNLPILTSCASCYSHLLDYPKLFTDDPEWRDLAASFAARLREWSSYILNETAIPTKLSELKQRSAEAPERLFYHDPCHLRFHCRITKPPRELLAGLPGFALGELPGGPQCCGQGGLFSLLHPDLSASIFLRLKNDLALVKPQTVTTTCSGCLLKLRQGLIRNQQPLQVVHPAILLAKALSRNYLL